MSEKKVQYGKYINFLILLLFAAIPPVFYSGIISNNMLLVSGDGASYFSLRNFFNDSLWSGEFPYWNKYLEGGIPYGAYDSVGLYPVGLLLSFLSPDIFSYAFYFVHLVIGAFFLYHFLQEIGCSRLASLIVSIIYETSIHINGYRKSHIMLIVGIVYLPVILYYIQKYLNTGKFRFLIFSSVFMGIQFLGAHTQVVLYTDVLCFFYLLVYYVKNKESVKKVIAHYAAWIGTYIGVALAQLYTILLIFADMAGIGTEPTSFDMFKSYSIHFVKLLQMAFPYIFGDNINQALSSSFSSEMDIELFLGFFVLICLIFCAAHLFRRFEVKLSLAFMAVAFAYSAMAHIPFLAQIIYRLPVFGGFRVPSRALFIFIFFALVLLGIFITELESRDTLEKFLAFGKKMSLAVLAGIMTIGIAAVGLSAAEDEIVNNIFKIKKVFLPSAIVCSTMVLLVLAYKYIPVLTKEPKRYYSLFCAVLLISTLAETHEFSIKSESVSKEYFTQGSSAVTAEIAASNYKIFDAFSGIDGAHQSLIGVNSAVDKELQGINSYLTYNNPRLYRMLSGNSTIPMNSSGLFTGFLNMREILSQKNDLLSVLGIRYLIDSSGLIADESRYYDSYETDEEIYRGSNSLMSSGNEFNVYSAPVSLTPNTLYKIEFDLDYITVPEMIYADVVTNTGYDGYNKEIIIDDEDKHFSVYYSTVSGVDYSDSGVRLVMKNSADVYVNNFAVYVCDAPSVNTENTDSTYAAESICVPTSEPDGYSLVTDSIALLPNTDYTVTFESYTESIGNYFYVDFYAEGFDAPEQQIDIVLTPGENQKHSYIFNSGNCPENGLLVRFVSNNADDIEVSDFAVAEMNNNVSGRYYPYYSGPEGNIYINPDAKDILFTVDSVQSIPENENIYSKIEEYDLLNKAYVQNYSSDIDLSDVNTEITDIDFTNNAITAKVNASADTFVNFSQCYYLGWKAYVDGQETKLYVVDDVIMGADVPAGQHTIEFRYAIPFFPVAVAFSVGVVVFWIIYFNVKDYSQRKKNADEKNDQTQNS